jgi:hypothetical protein
VLVGVDEEIRLNTVEAGAEEDETNNVDEVIEDRTEEATNRNIFVCFQPEVFIN